MHNDSDRFLVLVVILFVLAIALYTSRTTTNGLGLLVALVGLVVSYYRPVYGIPVTIAMAVVAATVPWAVLLIMAFAGLLMFATKAPGVASTKVNPVVGMGATDAARDIGGGFGS
jgi:hypothetical protein